MRLGQEFCKAPFLFLLVHPGVSWGVKPSLHHHPSYKIEAMTFCKLERWVLYKLVALTSRGECTGGKVFAQDIPRKVKVADVKARLSGETSLKICER